MKTLSSFTFAILTSLGVAAANVHNFAQAPSKITFSPLLMNVLSDGHRTDVDIKSQQIKLLQTGGFARVSHTLTYNTSAFFLHDIIQISGVQSVLCDGFKLTLTTPAAAQLSKPLIDRLRHHQTFQLWHDSVLEADKVKITSSAAVMSLDKFIRDGLHGKLLLLNGLETSTTAWQTPECAAFLTKAGEVSTLKTLLKDQAHLEPGVRMPFEVLRVNVESRGDTSIIHLDLSPVSPSVIAVHPMSSVSSIHSPHPVRSSSLWWKNASTSTKNTKTVNTPAEFDQLVMAFGGSDRLAASARIALLTSYRQAGVITQVSTDIEPDSPLLQPGLEADQSDYWGYNYTYNWDAFNLNYDDSTGSAAQDISMGSPNADCYNCYAEATLGFVAQFDLCHDIISLDPACPPDGERFQVMSVAMYVDGSIGLVIAAQASNVPPGSNGLVMYPSTFQTFDTLTIPLFEPLVLSIQPAFGLGGAVATDNGMGGKISWGFGITTNEAQFGFAYDYQNGFSEIYNWDPTVNTNVDPSVSGLSPTQSTTIFSLVPQVNFTLSISADGVAGVEAPLIINPYVNIQLDVAPSSNDAVTCVDYQMDYGLDFALSVGSLGFTVAGYDFTLWDGTDIGPATVMGPDPIPCSTCSGCA